jgi:ribosome assembly protein YihI (activator of Der GTPase)
LLLDMVAHAYNPITQEIRAEDHDFKVNLVYMQDLLQKKNKKRAGWQSGSNGRAPSQHEAPSSTLQKQPPKINKIK